MKPVRVLLLWPGTVGAAAGNFGVPQLVTLATWLRHRTGAAVTVIDLVAESALQGGTVDIPRVLRGDDGTGYDIVALGVYSSYDHLKCLHLASLARELYPEALLVAGGYHASARPDDVVYDGSPYDVCIVGEAEHSMVTLIESVAGGAPLRGAVMDSTPVKVLDDLPVTDWSFLARYQGVARKVASQTQLYLSRGCPFDCAFCMERAKREVSWRAYSVERAVEEFRALGRFLDLSQWTVYIADALFGMKVSWRREFLTRLAREDIRAQKLWLLIRVDLVEDADLDLFAAANCGLGFGLESGDPQLLATIRKAGRLDDYLDRMLHVADRAREIDLPWGANVICGHPGETEGSMHRSAAYMRKLFLDRRGTTGFLSVDPFRLYPGSPIDAERGAWEARFGTRFHRPVWWDDGDPEFLSEWVDPSADLDWRRRETLQHELLGPILREIPERFVYRGKARDYFHRAAVEQRDMLSPRTRAHYLDRYYAWQRYLGQAKAGRQRLAADTDTGRVLRAVRARWVASALQSARVDVATPDGARIEEALRSVRRERFVPLESLMASTRDQPVALDDTGMATVSAMHAYARSFSLLGVEPGDAVLDLGAGTGYGTALLAHLVGPGGRAAGLEVDPGLAARASELLGSLEGVATVQAGDALDPDAWPLRRPSKVTVGFALEALPAGWLAALPEGAVVVAPVRDEMGEGQRLVRAVVEGGQWRTEWFDPVLYVAMRRAVVAARTAPDEAATVARKAETRRLPILG